MNTTITLTLVKGKREAGEYTFTDPKRCVVGRGLDCDIPVPTDEFSHDVSRHHCAFELDPPLVRVRNLNSLNGTYVNDIKIGQREDIAWDEDSADGTARGVELHSGDEVRLGQLTALRVSVIPSPEYAMSSRGVGSYHEFEETGYDHNE